HIESWHNKSKTHFLKDRRKRRADTVIHILANSVVPYYQHKGLRSRLRVGWMTAGSERKAYEYLCQQRMQGYDGMFVFTTEDPAVLRVRSFQDSVYNDDVTFYRIQFSFERNADIGNIVHCECPAFQRSKTCCKRIALVVL